MESRERIKRAEAKERASYDYILANLITKGTQAAINGGEGIPDITEIYPSVFIEEIEDRQNKKQAKIDELSALRFKQFANFHNNKINKEVAKT
jgi:hypothetical protein